MDASKQIALFGMTIDAVSLDEAAQIVCGWAQSDGACRFVVTPNVDHAIQFQENAALRTAYERAALVVADGAPVVAAARWLGRPVPGRVAGSDLVPAVFARADAQFARAGDGAARRLRVFLLGAGPGVAERAANYIHARWPGVEVVDVYSPPMGFERDAAERRAINERINAAQAELLLIGLGAPKQELWIADEAAALNVRAALCIGATIDFLAGEKARAPRWMQRLGLEWVHRMLSEPRRLVKRYARDAWIFPRLMWREWRQARNGAPPQSSGSASRV